jgi:hypothetical protein
VRKGAKFATFGVALGAALATAVPLVFADNGTPSTRVLSTTLRGRAEISTVTGQKGAGDPDGIGGATVLVTPTQVCAGIVVTGLTTPTAAHIHQADRRHNGPIVVPLTAPASGNPGSSSTCVAVSAQLSLALRSNPGAFYVNVHTADFPNGAMRGQLGGHHGGGDQHDDDD